MACYFIIATTYIFFLPRITQITRSHSVSHNSDFKRKGDSMNGNDRQAGYLQRTDKSTFEDRRSMTSVLNVVTGSFILLLFIVQLWKLTPRSVFNSIRPRVNYQYVYLSLCTFRI